MNKVELLFLDRSINRGGILLYTRTDAIDFIRQCKNCNISILGIDGFFISEKVTQPSLEDSIDFSNKIPINNIYEKSIEFIEKSDENLYFEIICQ